ncbi:MAG: hypothetical protein PVG39_04655 [Desulfobacteraceae bacterium]|jgi:hypothetical protein
MINVTIKWLRDYIASSGTRRDPAWFGHKVKWDREARCFHYKDGSKVDKYDLRPCPKCGMKRTKEGHDPCLGTLPGVIGACCGHGIEEGYIAFENRMVIHGFFTRIEKSEIPE